jgi:bacterioferritin-associated ferredoxin
MSSPASDPTRESNFQSTFCDLIENRYGNAALLRLPIDFAYELHRAAAISIAQKSLKLSNKNFYHPCLTMILILSTLPESSIDGSLYAMYVCLCNGITDREIKQSIREGASSLQDLHDNLGVASQCGQCACLTQQLLDDTLQNLNSGLAYAAA